MDPIITKVQADLEEANEEIAALQVKLNAARGRAKMYRDFLEMYGPPSPQEQDLLAGMPLVPLPRFLPNADPKAAPSSGGHTAKARITSLAAQILSDGKPRLLRDLLNEITARGEVPGGKDKALALSALLSKDDRFVPDRTRGWSLKK